jgi:predicted aspartyl protease
MRKEPLLKKDYTYNKEKNKYTPFLEVLVGTKDSKKTIVALVDTGCDPCMSLCKSYIAERGLTFIQKMNKEPIPIGVADGHTINADSYKAICQINKEEKEIEVCVIDPETFFEEEEPEVGTVTPLLGRGILDEYDLLFEGKNKKFALFCPE